VSPVSDRTPAQSARPRPRLARELLWHLGLLGAAALSLAVGTAIAAAALPPRIAVIGLVALIVADLGVLLAFGRSLVGRLVIRPVRALMGAADAIAAGDLAARAPAAETEEFTRLAERLNDMTEALLDAQGQLVRAEKLAGIGRLAAGVAHEIGNPLAAMGTYLEVLRRRGTADPDVVADLAREADRIDRIVRGLLAYARSDDHASYRLDPAAAVRSVVDLLGRQGRLSQPPARIEIVDPLPPVRGRSEAVEQVLVNLVLNALDADPTGRITVEARPFVFHRGGSDARVGERGAVPAPRRSGPTRRPTRPDLAPGTPGVLLVVADRGPGVPPADRERVFDPFFTTKPPGAGTGLGLAIVQRTVHELGGLVWVDDAREGGAAFKVFLPAEP
jgi:signal transduction histidine kinase